LTDSSIEILRLIALLFSDETIKVSFSVKTILLIAILAASFGKIGKDVITVYIELTTSAVES
jgi:hypothetical protein